MDLRWKVKALEGPPKEEKKEERRKENDGSGFPLATGLGESLSPWLIVVPLSTRPVDGVRKEKERLTAAP